MMIEPETKVKADDDDTRLPQSRDDRERSLLNVVDAHTGLMSLADFGSFDLCTPPPSARQFSSTTDNTDDCSLRRLRDELRFSSSG